MMVLRIRLECDTASTVQASTLNLNDSLSYKSRHCVMYESRDADLVFLDNVGKMVVGCSCKAHFLV